ncbi:MAG: amidohydrolase family protein [Gemmatimonadales bacterium]
MGLVRAFSRRSWASGLALVVAAGSACGGAAETGPYDLVIAGGRVMDPESGLDAVRSVGLRDGRIAAISEGALSGARTIDATGLVVAPGFVDLHAHGNGYGGDRWQVQDGVTTSLELEEGAYPVAEWYRSLEGKSYVNFGASAGHIPARVAVLQGAKTLEEARAMRHEASDPPPVWSHHLATPEERQRILTTIQAGLEAGGLGIGFEVNESPGASREEILELFRLAERMGVPIYAHLRLMGQDPIAGSIAGAQEVLADALVTGASTHFVHLGSSGLGYAAELVGMIEAARARGLDVTTEVYPYTAASTGIETALFEGDWRGRLGIDYGDLEWPPTGERFTEQSFGQFRARGGPVIVHMMKESNVELLLARPGVMVASDAMPLIDGRGHPRGVGTFARVLGRYVRERKTLSLMDALRKMTLEPAERVRGAAPSMARKGRIAVGADADLALFDPETVIDRATFAEPTQASVGIPYVVVGGTVVVDGGVLQAAARPGRGIRRGDP